MGYQLFIPVRVTLLNWIITILAGSLIYAFLDAYFTKSDGFLQIVQFVGFATVYSGLYSLPALIILLLVNWWLNKRSRSPRSYQVIHTVVQLLIAGGSFLWLVWGWGSDWFTYVDLIYLLPFLATYAGVTLIVWAITFSIYRSKDDMD